jgi:hypothetical protein
MSSIDQKLGLRKFVKYLVVFALVVFLAPVVLFPKKTIKETVKFVLEISNEIESEKMDNRDVVIRELNPLLRELRAETCADRVTYYEYHNSIENEAGVPFKFVDLVQQASKMGLPEISPRDNVNVSRFAELYCDLQDSGYVLNTGRIDFFYRYPGSSEILNGSKMQLFINIPGINKPLGIVVLEWQEYNNNIPWNSIVQYGYREGSRINSLMGRLTN